MKSDIKKSEEMLKALTLLLELRKEIEASMEDEKEETSKEGEILNDLKNDFTSCFKWALNLEHKEKVDAEEGKKIWERLHPDLPIPRVCLCEAGSIGHSFTMLFLMDAYPHYLKHKNKQ